jgi:hypothetical protein
MVEVILGCFDNDFMRSNNKSGSLSLYFYELKLKIVSAFSDFEINLHFPKISFLFCIAKMQWSFFDLFICRVEPSVVLVGACIGLSRWVFGRGM